MKWKPRNAKCKINTTEERIIGLKIDSTSPRKQQERIFSFSFRRNMRVVMRHGEQNENCQATSSNVSEEKEIFKGLTVDKFKERLNPCRKMAR